MKEEKFPNTRKPSHLWVCGEFWNLRGQHNREEKNQNPHIMCLTTTASGEVAQGLAEAGLYHQTGPECPEDNMKDLT